MPQPRPQRKNSVIHHRGRGEDVQGTNEPTLTCPRIRCTGADFRHPAHTMTDRAPEGKETTFQQVPNPHHAPQTSRPEPERNAPSAVPHASSSCSTLHPPQGHLLGLVRRTRLTDAIPQSPPNRGPRHPTRQSAIWKPITLWPIWRREGAQPSTHRSEPVRQQSP